MAKKKQEIEIAVNYKTNQGQVTKEMTEAEKEAKKLADQLKATEKAQDDLSKSTEQAGKALIDNTVVTEGLDKVTGGLFSTIKNLTFGLVDGVRNIVNYTKGMFSATTATGGLTTGMKLLRGALISTGIGAFVVALGMVVSYMNNATKSTKGFIGSLNDLGDNLSDETQYAMKFAEAARDADKAMVGVELSKLENDFKAKLISHSNYVKERAKLNQELVDIDNEYNNLIYGIINNSDLDSHSIFGDEKYINFHKQLYELDVLFGRQIVNISNNYNTFSEALKHKYEDGRISLEQYNKEIKKLSDKFLNDEKNTTLRYNEEKRKIQNKEYGLISAEIDKQNEEILDKEESFYKKSLDILSNQGIVLSGGLGLLVSKLKKDIDDDIDQLKIQNEDFYVISESLRSSSKKDIENKRNEIEIQKKLELEEKALELSRLDRNRKREVENQFTLGIQEKFYALFNENEAKRIDDLEKNSNILNKTERFEATKLTNTYYNAQKDILTEKENLYNTWNSLDLEQFAIDMTNVGNTKGMTNFINKLMGIDDDLDKQLNQVKENVEARIDIIKSATIELQSYEIDKTRESQEKLAELRIDAIEKEREFKLLELEELKASEEEKEKIRQYYNTEMVREAENAQKALKEIDKRELAGKMALADGISSIFDSLSSQSKENGSIAKGLGIASVMIDTTVSAISAYKGMVEQFPGPVGIAAGAVAATAIGLNGLQAINKIKAVKVDGSENGGGGGSVATNQPNVQFVSSSENQIANTINATNENIADNPAEQEPIKAYVVSSDISTAQSLERNAINNSSL